MDAIVVASIFLANKKRRRFLVETAELVRSVFDDFSQRRNSERSERHRIHHSKVVAEKRQAKRRKKKDADFASIFLANKKRRRFLVETAELESATPCMSSILHA